jgi:hypothetical protein
MRGSGREEKDSQGKETAVSFPWGYGMKRPKFDYTAKDQQMTEPTPEARNFKNLYFTCSLQDSNRVPSLGSMAHQPCPEPYYSHAPPSPSASLDRFCGTAPMRPSTLVLSISSACSASSQNDRTGNHPSARH